MKDYLRLLEQQASYSDVRIDWSVIKPDQLAPYRAGRRMGLQIADAVAGSFCYAVEPSQYGYAEYRYARMLRPAVYHHNSRYIGYGLKFWPGEVEDLLEVEERFGWGRSKYK